MIRSFLLGLALLSGCAWLDQFAPIETDPTIAPERQRLADRFRDDDGCIRNVPGHAAALLWAPETEFENRLESELLPDLDGDTLPERRWHLAQDCNDRGHCSSLLYLSGHGCTQLAGRIDGALTPMSTTTAGRQDLWMWWGAGCLGREGSAQVLRFEEGGYRAEEYAYCPCDGERPALCDQPAG